jgi:hypothetical protein
MIPMFRASISRFALCLALLALAVGSVSLAAQDQSITRSRKYRVPPPSSRVEVTVLRDSNGKPIEAAAVIFHPMEGERDKGSMELKTNEDGKAVIDVIPVGDVVRLQIIAKGFQTYGQDYKIDKVSMSMEIRMKRPGEQYSIYKLHDNADSGASNDKSAKPSSEGSQPPADNSKQPDSGSQAKPNQSQQ